MKAFILLTGSLFLTIMNSTAQQRVVAECTLIYHISAEDAGTDKESAESFKSSVKTVYIKGNNSRTDLVSPVFTQSMIYDKGTASAVILREFGNNKLMTKLDHAKWMIANKLYEGMTVSYVNEAKTILGYECKKAVLQLKDGTSFTLYYATTIIPSVKEFEYQFKDIPGFVLEYESKEADGKRIKYTATKINMSPVPVSKFDIPTSGYRLLD